MEKHEEVQLNEQNACSESERFIAGIPPYPGERYAGRGIVICGGAVRYFTNAWVCINILRQHGCKLPIQIWHLGPEELDERMAELVRPLGVECVDGRHVRESHPVRTLGGWEMKAYSIIHSPFQEVLLLDSDNVALRDPDFLFSTQQFKKTGALFWPDYGRLGPQRSIWRICGIPYRDEPEFESGQIAIDKQRCWKAMQLCMWYNEHSDFFYNHVHGDKETFHLAFRKLDQPYSMPDRPIHPLEATMCQHDFEGKRLFQHRNMDKWSLFRENQRIPDFVLEQDCLKHLGKLRVRWDGVIESKHRYTPGGRNEGELNAAKELTSGVFRYRRIGHDERAMHFCPNGLVGLGAAGCELYWNLENKQDGITLLISSASEVTCTLKRDVDGAWRGQWQIHERMPVEVSRIDYEWQVPSVLPGQTVRIHALNCSGWRNLAYRNLIADLDALGLEVQEATIDEESTQQMGTFVSLDIDRSGLAAALLIRVVDPDKSASAHRVAVLFDLRGMTQEVRMWLNSLDAVVCDSERLALWLHASGITTHLAVVKRPTGGVKGQRGNDGTVCRFGAAFNREDVLQLPAILSAFQHAFPREKDVRLMLLAPPDSVQKEFNDGRIELRLGKIGDEAWGAWIGELDCLVARGPICEMEFLEQEAKSRGIPVVGMASALLGILPSISLLSTRSTQTGSFLPKYEPMIEYVVGAIREVRLALKRIRESTRRQALIANGHMGKQRESFAVGIASLLSVVSETLGTRELSCKFSICAVIESDAVSWKRTLENLVELLADVHPGLVLFCSPQSLGTVNRLAAGMKCPVRILVGTEKMKPGEAVFTAMSRSFEHSDCVLAVRDDFAMSDFQTGCLKTFVLGKANKKWWGATFAPPQSRTQSNGKLSSQPAVWLNPAGFLIGRERWSETLNWGKLGGDDFTASCLEQLRLRGQFVEVFPVNPPAPDKPDNNQGSGQKGSSPEEYPSKARQKASSTDFATTAA